MKETHQPHSAGTGRLPSLGISVLAAYLSAPSLLEAWQHDGYSRGGLAAFGIWFLVLAGVRFLPNANSHRHAVLWTVLAALCCAAGSMADLRVLYHLGLACALTGFAGFGSSGVMAVALAVAWMPATGWFLSRVFSGGLVGWERPAAVLAGFLVFLIAAVCGKPRHS